MPAFPAAALVFLSSAAVLVLEILAARLLAPYVGDTLETYTAIIGTITISTKNNRNRVRKLASRSLRPPIRPCSDISRAERTHGGAARRNLSTNRLDVPGAVLRLQSLIHPGL